MYMIRDGKKRRLGRGLQEKVKLKNSKITNLTAEPNLPQPTDSLAHHVFSSITKITKGPGLSSFGRDSFESF
jgi:hypothetical protein